MKVNPAYLMTQEEGIAWHAFKAALGPIYPGYESFDRFMHWMREQLELKQKLQKTIMLSMLTTK